jgi:SAM-dependent methyltransferase
VKSARDERLGVVGFATGAERYERGRPGYPPDFIEALSGLGVLGPGRRVADVAAGTGKLTRQLQATGAGCVAVEPSGDMREVCRRAVAGLPVTAGVAEALPLRTGGFDLVTVAQAFHWFRAPEALAEFRRVLRRDGVLAIVWNERDEGVPWVAELGRLMAVAGDLPHERAAAYFPLVDASGHFGGTARWRFAFEVPLARILVLDLVASRSYVNVMAPDSQARLLRRVADLVDGLDDPVPVPYVTDVYVARAA